MLGLSDKELVAQCMQRVANSKMKPDWGQDFRYVQVEDAKLDELEPMVTFRVRAEPHMANPSGTMHGGCVVTMIDNLTSWATFAVPKYWAEAKSVKDGYITASKDMGPSRNLTANFLRPVPIGEDFFVVCKVCSDSKRMAFATAEIKSQVGKVLVYGSQDMVKVTSKL